MFVRLSYWWRFRFGGRVRVFLRMHAAEQKLNLWKAVIRFLIPNSRDLL